MADIRLKKMVRDLSADWQRTLIVVLAIAIGIFAFSSVIVAYSILDREMNVNYLGTNPPSAILWTNPVDATVIDKALDTGIVRDAEARRSVTARVLVGPDQWRRLTIFVIDNYNDVRIAKVRPESGSWPPERGEILIERAAMPLIPAKTGQPLTVKTPDGPVVQLQVAGVVHDPAQAPANMENTAYGYITEATLSDIGEKPNLDQLMVITSGASSDEKTIRAAAFRLKDKLEESGTKVSRIEIPVPGKHPHASQMAALLFLFEAFGLLSFVLSLMLAVTMINGLLARQVRQIGIMKTLGAVTSQITGMYLGMIFILSIAATVIALPLAVHAGTALAALVAGMLNFNLTSTAIPFWVFILIAGSGLLAPPAASLFSISRGCRITIREAINDYGVSVTEIREKRSISKRIAKILSIPGPVLFSIRNIFRKKSRVAQVILTLAVGGALFIIAMNLSASMDTTVDNALDTRQISDIIFFSDYHTGQEIAGSLARVPGIARFEPLTVTNASLAATDNTDSNQFTLFGIQPDTAMVNYPILEGRWLQSGDTNAIVLNHVLADDLKKRGLVQDIRAGDTIVLVINQTRTEWRVAGIAREMLAPPRAYVSSDYLGFCSGRNGSANAVVIRAAESVQAPATRPLISFQVHGRELSIPSPHGTTGSQPDVFTPTLERGMQDTGMNVTTITSIGDMRLMMKEHLVVIAALVTLLAFLVVAVGILSLISAMNISVVERQREIGIMRAIGATPHAIIGMLATEALVIALISWVVAVLAAPFLSVAVGNLFGTIFFKSPLDIAVSHTGMIAWLVIIVILAPLASILSARNALRQQIHEVLAYE